MASAIGMKVRTRSDVKKVLRKARRAFITSLGYAGASIRLVARRSIRAGTTPSRPGTPPRTKTRRLKTAIVYAVEPKAQRVIIGPDYAVVGTVGMAHEFGGRYKKQRYPKRPFMGPALEKTKDRLPRHWAGSVR